MQKNPIIALIAFGSLVATAALGQPAPGPAPAAAGGTRAAAVQRLADDLEAQYTLPDIGKLYAAALRERLARGDYETPSDTAALAKLLTADLQAVHADKHIHVTLDEDGPTGPAQGAGPLRPALKGVEEARWIEPGIAYIRFDVFDGSPKEVAAVEAFMKAHLSAKAIIIDARGHHGGGLAEMNVMLPYLYARKTVLVDMDVAKAIAEQGETPLGQAGLVTIKAPPGILRQQHVVTPHPSEHRLFKAKVFYLTSTRTASAAEHLALAFKRTHRAVLVGEHTAGANHFGRMEPLGAGLAAFIPVGRTFDPDTGEDWEGRGILPDVPVPADQALDVALKLARNGGA